MNIQFKNIKDPHKISYYSNIEIIINVRKNQPIQILEMIFNCDPFDGRKRDG